MGLARLEGGQISMTKPPKDGEEVGRESDPLTSEPVNISTDRAWRQTQTGGGGGGGHTVGERLSRLEALFESFQSVVDSLRHGQNWTLGAIGILAALMIGMGAYMLNRMDTISDKVEAVPQQVNANIRDLTQTLAVAITASKQQQPQVILLPQPQPPAAHPKHP
jgi:hypothetical protein